MPRCDLCNTIILFGAIEEDGLTFCNDKCREDAVLYRMAGLFPEEEVRKHVEQAHRSDCPVCGGPGPVDVHVTHHIWSLVFISSCQNRIHICCRSCGMKARVRAVFGSGLLGWWGVPWGMLGTPVQMLRNVIGMMMLPDPDIPSARFERWARLDLATHLLAQQQEGDVEPEPEWT
ncbi:hypothetical protein AB1L88_03635 [Tautonia sp. JC769]|uniref:hypothetical protein n=1 Tax=Tautonia sp. JC769 TaxID=3232135 RepID=UPI00345A204F